MSVLANGFESVERGVMDSARQSPKWIETIGVLFVEGRSRQMNHLGLLLTTETTPALQPA